MEGAKKKEFGDPVSAKIQQRFDLVFTGADAKIHAVNDSSAMDSDFGEIDFGGSSSHEDTQMANEKTKPAVNLDFDAENDEIQFDQASPPPVENIKKAETTAKLAIVPDEGGLEFNLDFDDAPIEHKSETSSAPSSAKAVDDTNGGLNINFDFDDAEIESSSSVSATSVTESKEMGGLLEIDDSFIPDETEDDKTQKTIVYKPKSESDLDANFESDLSNDLMSSEEAKANIESTIKDILKPKLSAQPEGTADLDLAALAAQSQSEDDFFNNTSSINLGAGGSNSESTSEFDLSSVVLADKDETDDLFSEAPYSPAKEPSFSDIAVPDYVQSKPQAKVEEIPVAAPKALAERVSVPAMNSSFVSDDESNRLQATIRQLREERESLVAEIKTMKGVVREFEQDNLTLKAAFDEAKIEISILRKRHMVELEDMKYRVHMSEEKRALAEERARMAEQRREKLEQKVRIDFNQVKQREKELETKLEMLTIDVDAQVHSRDQKILELRRKIDALEFNMENVSIKEQKSQDDKRKLEDKLNKIMKTLRHSIKNLEDDIDQATEDGQDGKETKAMKKTF